MANRQTTTRYNLNNNGRTVRIISIREADVDDPATTIVVQRVRDVVDPVVERARLARQLTRAQNKADEIQAQIDSLDAL